jgi:hypothetical protein
MPKIRVRPDRVSCEFCRTKKLKCSRVQPCSNCSARGITCTFLVPPSRGTSAITGESLILSHIEQLQSTVFSLQQRLHAQDRSTNAPSTTASSHLANYPRSEASEHVSEEVGYLENIGTRDDTLVGIPQSKKAQRRCTTADHGKLCDMSAPLAYEVRTLPEILVTLDRNQDKQSAHSMIRLPPFNKASLLLQTYETKLLSICPIVHMPTIRSLLRTTYLRIHDPTLVLPSSVAILYRTFESFQ